MMLKHRSELPILLDACNIKSVVEIGVGAGDFARVMLSSGICEYIGIDDWRNPADAQRRLRALELLYDSRADIIEEHSETAISRFDDESIDMVYIDAMHDCESVYGDLVRWWPKCSRVIAGHDYGLWNHAANCPMGTIPAVEQFAQERGLVVWVTGAASPTIADRLKAAYDCLFVEPGDQGDNIPSFYIFK
jgi:hypothetical protein